VVLRPLRKPHWKLVIMFRDSRYQTSLSFIISPCGFGG